MKLTINEKAELKTWFTPNDKIKTLTKFINKLSKKDINVLRNTILK